MHVEAIIAAETNKKMECIINQHIKAIFAKVLIRDFGDSDCKKRCRSHLRYFPDDQNRDLLLQKLVRIFQSASGIFSYCTID